MKKHTCVQDIEALLSDLPSKWRKQIANTICSAITFSEELDCANFTECETLTTLSDFSREGSVISITYTAENGVSVTRSFDFQDIVNTSLDSVDPKCVASAEDWANATFAERFQFLIDYACSTCGGSTTTTTTLP